MLAWAASQGSSVAALLDNLPTLMLVLQYHVVTTKYADAAAMAAAGALPTMATGKALNVSGS
jgi:hypothetical protein